jgi:hypothetical protein
MFKVVLMTDDPEALIARAKKGRYKVAETVKLMDMSTNAVEEHSIKEFKTHRILNFLKRMAIFFTTLFAILGLLEFSIVWLYGLIGAYGQFGMEGLYVTAGSVMAILVWPLAWRLLDHPRRRKSESIPVYMTVDTSQRGITASEIH